MKDINENIENILHDALYDGINYWCHKIEKEDKKITEGGNITLHTSLGKFILNEDKLLNGLSAYLKDNEDLIIETSDIDSDIVVQLAIFNEIIFS